MLPYLQVGCVKASAPTTSKRHLLRTTIMTNKGKSNIRSDAPYSSERIFFDITLTKAGVNGPSVSCLYDTGANVSLMCAKDFEKVKQANRVVQELKHDKLRIVNASGKPMPIVGVYIVRFEVNGVSVTAPFSVSPDMKTGTIVGMNIIRKFGLIANQTHTGVVINPAHMSAAVGAVTALEGDGPVDVVVHTAVTITARNARLVKCFLRRKDGSKVAKAKEFMADLEIMNVAACSDEFGNFSFYIPNASFDDDCELPRGTVIGSASPFDDTDFLTDDEAVQAAKVDSVSAVTRGQAKADNKPADPEVMEILSATVKAHVPQMWQQKYLNTLRARASAFSTGANDIGYTELVKHNVELTDNVPVYTQQYRLPADQLAFIKDNVTAWLQLGIIEPSRSKYNSAIFCVPKPGGRGLRTVLDYRQVNAKTLPDKYSIRPIDQCLEEIGHSGSNIFSMMDATMGFWHMCLEESSRPCTAFTLPGVGQFQWVTTPMGLTGSPASFCRLMDLILADVKNVICYVDDILLHTEGHEKHLAKLGEVLDRLVKADIKLNPRKCVFGATTVQYLGRTVSKEGVSPGQCKTEAVLDAVPPTTMKMLKSFMGLANYFRGFIENFAIVAGPLFRLTRKDAQWSGGRLPEDALLAFETLKKAITDKPVLALPQRNGVYHMYVDAAQGDKDNAGGLGVVLWQEQTDSKFDKLPGTKEPGKKVVAYASRRLLEYEKNYPPFLLEMMAAVYGMETFDVYLRARRFYLYTDHKPLTRLSTVHTKTLNRLQLKMQEMHPDIRYVDGKSNTVADFLSRYHGLGVGKIDSSPYRIEKLQRDDEDLLLVRKSAEEQDIIVGDDITDHKTFKHPGSRALWKYHTGILLVLPPSRKGFLDTSDGWRVVLPKSMYKEVIEEAHGGNVFAGHGGVFKTGERLRQEFWWGTMDKDIAEHISKCQPCQATTNKGTIKNKPPLSPLPIPIRPRDHVHIDTFGPLKNNSKNGNKYVCVVTDSFTKLVWLKATPSKDAPDIAAACLEYMYIYGIPKQITTDNGSEYVNELQKAIWDSLQIDHNVTTPYHPQANASVERKNAHLIQFLRTAIEAHEASTLDWELFLGPVMLSYNSAVHKSTRVSPFYATFGGEPNLPLWDTVIEKGDENIKDKGVAQNLIDLRTAQTTSHRVIFQNTQHARDEYTQAHDKAHHVQMPTFEEGDLVWVKIMDKGPNPKFAAAWEKGHIVERKSSVTYRVNRHGRRKKVKTLNVQQLKPRKEEDDQPGDRAVAYCEFDGLFHDLGAVLEARGDKEFFQDLADAINNPCDSCDNGAALLRVSSIQDVKQLEEERRYMRLLHAGLLYTGQGADRMPQHVQPAHPQPLGPPPGFQVLQQPLLPHREEGHMEQHLQEAHPTAPLPELVQRHVPRQQHMQENHVPFIPPYAQVRHHVPLEQHLQEVHPIAPQQVFAPQLPPVRRQVHPIRQPVGPLWAPEPPALPQINSHPQPQRARVAPQVQVPSRQPLPADVPQQHRPRENPFQQLWQGQHQLPPVRGGRPLPAIPLSEHRAPPPIPGSVQGSRQESRATRNLQDFNHSGSRDQTSHASTSQLPDNVNRSGRRRRTHNEGTHFASSIRALAWNECAAFAKARTSSPSSQWVGDQLCPQ